MTEQARPSPISDSYRRVTPYLTVHGANCPAMDGGVVR